jgi:hypothetical protein
MADFVKATQCTLGALLGAACLVAVGLKQLHGAAGA